MEYRNTQHTKPLVLDVFGACSAPNGRVDDQVASAPERNTPARRAALSTVPNKELEPQA